MSRANSPETERNIYAFETLRNRILSDYNVFKEMVERTYGNFETWQAASAALKPLGSDRRELSRSFHLLITDALLEGHDKYPTDAELPEISEDNYVDLGRLAIIERSPCDDMQPALS